MTYSQVWWPILRICALHLPIQVHTHTHSSEHTHTVNTHPEQWALGSHLCWGTQGAVGGSVPCSSRGIDGEESAVHLLPPPTIPAGPRLELTTFGLQNPTL